MSARIPTTLQLLALSTVVSFEVMAIPTEGQLVDQVIPHMVAESCQQVPALGAETQALGQRPTEMVPSKRLLDGPPNRGLHSADSSTKGSANTLITMDRASLSTAASCGRPQLL